MKKTIDAWLFWAYRDQLPLLAPDWRGPDDIGEGWNKIGSWSVGGTNRYGVVHALDQGRVCDPLARALADRVLSLDEVLIGLPDGWDPCEDFDMGALGLEGAGLSARAAAMATHVDRDGQRRLKRPVSDIVRRYALTGEAPAWECEPPQREVVKHWNGEPRWFVRRRIATDMDLHGNPIYREVEQDGWDAKRRRPHVDAYRRYELRPCPVAALAARAEYEVLHAALAVLVEEWPGWAEHDVLESVLPERPWMSGPGHKPRILLAENSG